MTCVVRDSRAEDMAEVQAIYAHHVLHGAASFEEEPPSLAEMQRRRADVLARGMPYLVAEIGGQGRGLQLRVAVSGAAGLSLRARELGLCRPRAPRVPASVVRCSRR